MPVSNIKKIKRIISFKKECAKLKHDLLCDEAIDSLEHESEQYVLLAISALDQAERFLTLTQFAVVP